MTKLTLLLLPITALLAQGPAAPSQPAQGVLVLSTKGFYSMVQSNIVKAAEKMPEENYSFKPTPDVRTFGQLVGHVADAQYHFCATVSGAKGPDGSIEKTKTSKADLVQALKDSVAFCNAAYDGLSDADAVAPMKFMGFQATKLLALSVNTAHDDEHYGNMVTYMRLKGIVPPSSEPKK